MASLLADTYGSPQRSHWTNVSLADATQYSVVWDNEIVDTDNQWFSGSQINVPSDCSRVAISAYVKFAESNNLRLAYNTRVQIDWSAEYYPGESNWELNHEWDADVGNATHCAMNIDSATFTNMGGENFTLDVRQTNFFGAPIDLEEAWIFVQYLDMV